MGALNIPETGFLIVEVRGYNHRKEQTTIENFLDFIRTEA